MVGAPAVQIAALTCENTVSDRCAPGRTRTCGQVLRRYAGPNAVLTCVFAGRASPNEPRALGLFSSPVEKGTAPGPHGGRRGGWDCGSAIRAERRPRARHAYRSPARHRPCRRRSEGGGIGIVYPRSQNVPWTVLTFDLGLDSVDGCRPTCPTGFFAAAGRSGTGFGRCECSGI